jgi:hypothetical protein
MSPPTHTHKNSWRLTWLLAAVLFVAALLNNSKAIFQTHIYEADDYAANSLQVLKAKSFHETVGNYCRFGFHHPGPAFFYIYAAGEAIFFDGLHVVPTPFNGQLIAHSALAAFFVGASLAIVATWMARGRRLFMAAALLLGAAHFGAVGQFYNFIPEKLGLLAPWPPAFIVWPFLCFLVGAASIAAGNGHDLSATALAGCFLVHGHVAMPLFVGPLALLAYIAFSFETRRQRQGNPVALFARQHWFTAGIIALFLLPILIDWTTGRPSNLERIVSHVRNNYGEGKTLLQSILYFAHFATYAGYPSRWPTPTFENPTVAGLRSFFLLHWRVIALWTCALLMVPLLTRTGAWKASAQPAARRFQQRMLLVLGAASALSIAWGCLQEGPMYDYNALFNFAIYYGLLLVVAFTAAVWIVETYPSRAQLAILAALALALVVVFAQKRHSFQSAVSDNEQRQFAASVEKALQLDPAAPKFLNFDWRANAQATRVAVYLERKRIAWWSRENWPLQFGEDRVLQPGKAGQPVPTLASSFWWMLLHENARPTESDDRGVVLPLTHDVDLVIYPGK